MRPLTPLAALLVAVAACHDSTSPSASVAGHWTVQTVNGAALPFTVQVIGANKEELLARAYDLAAPNASGGTFTQTETQRFTQAGQVSTVSGSNTGTYVQRGDSLVFSYEGTTATDRAAWDGHNTLTLVDGPNVSVLTR